MSRIGKGHFDVKAAQREFATTWEPFGLTHKGGLDKYASNTVLDEIARVHEDFSGSSLR